MSVAAHHATLQPVSKLELVTTDPAIHAAPHTPQCPQGDVDVVALHAYTSPLGLALQVLEVQHIATALKARWIVQEFGVTNTNATARQVAYSQQIQAAASTGGATPWSFWCLQITSAPNPDSLALWVNDPTWSKVIVPAAAKAAATSSPLQAWPEIWGDNVGVTVS